MTDIQDMEDIELMIVRGKLSTVNSARKGCMRDLQTAGGKLQAAAARIMKLSQPENREPVDLSSALEMIRGALAEIEQTGTRIESLDFTRAELQHLAWPR